MRVRKGLRRDGRRRAGREGDHEGGGPVAAGRKRRRGCGSYDGEASEAPESARLKGDGTHGFAADAPDEPWMTGIAEFGTKAGKACPSPMTGCLDGMPLGRSKSTSPNAGLASSSLSGACAPPAEGDHPRARNDGGRRYRWPGWTSICDEHGLVRSVSRRGRSPDDSRMGGLLRQAEDRVLLRARSGRRGAGRVHGHARRVSDVAS